VAWQLLTRQGDGRPRFKELAGVGEGSARALAQRVGLAVGERETLALPQALPLEEAEPLTEALALTLGVGLSMGGIVFLTTIATR
jgi:hypothetical protein